MGKEKSITLLGDASIYEIDQLRDQLKRELNAAVKDGCDLIIDLDQIGNFDATFIQLLVLAKKDPLYEDVAIKLQGAPPEFSQKIEELHLVDLLR